MRNVFWIAMIAGLLNLGTAQSQQAVPPGRLLTKVATQVRPAIPRIVLGPRPLLHSILWTPDRPGLQVNNPAAPPGTLSLSWVQPQPVQPRTTSLFNTPWRLRKGGLGYVELVRPANVDTTVLQLPDWTPPPSPPDPPLPHLITKLIAMTTHVQKLSKAIGKITSPEFTLHMGGWPIKFMPRLSASSPGLVIQAPLPVISHDQ